MASSSKPVVNSWEAAYLTRQGRSDLELMKRYAISAKGLESLFRKLVQAGALTAEELEQRSKQFQRTHAIDLLSDTEPRPKEKCSVSASEALGCIRSGLSDQEIMERYDISTKGLESLFRKLVARGIIRQEDIDARRSSQETTEVEVILAPQLPSTLTAPPLGRGTVQVPQAAPREAAQPYAWTIEQDPTLPLSGTAIPHYGLPTELKSKERFPRLWACMRKHRVALAATFGAIGGVVMLTVAFGLIAGVDYAVDSLVGFRKPKPAPIAPVDPFTSEAERTARMLKSINEEAGKSPDARPSEGQPTGERRSRAYEECLRGCEKDAAGGDTADKVEMLYCKRDCAARFSNQARKIRQRYHLPAVQY